MFKFVAVVAFLAVATASPDPALISTLPLGYSTGISPAVTTYSAAPVLYSSPAVAYPTNYGYNYGYNYGHLIKKRSAPLVSTYFASAPLTYTSPLATTYAAAPLANTYATTYSAPLVHSSPFYTTAHFIKKRSAPLIVPSASYIPPGVYSSTPIVSAYSTYSAAAPIYSSPYGYTQFIKK